MADIDTIKQKFEKIQALSQEYEKQKIKIETELNTLQTDYNKNLDTLLKATGTTTLEEAKTKIESEKADLDKQLEELNTSLDSYLNKVSES